MDDPKPIANMSDEEVLREYRRIDPADGYDDRADDLCDAMLDRQIEF